MSYLSCLRDTRKRKHTVKGLVYFMRSGDFVKIGFTTSAPERRLRSLQTGNPEPIDVWAYFDGSMEDERRLHAVFSPVAIHGEWFGIDGKLRDLLWYITPDGPDKFIPREVFENAMFDCVSTGMTHPLIDNEALHASAIADAWAFI